jgi:hypothetical protein
MQIVVKLLTTLFLCLSHSGRYAREGSRKEDGAKRETEDEISWSYMD